MNPLLSLLGSLLDPARVSFPAALVARWTLLLALAWLAHAALAGRNPRWRVALWRVTAAGLVAVSLLAWVPPIVRVPTIERSRPAISGRGTNPAISRPTRLSTGRSPCRSHVPASPGDQIESATRVPSEGRIVPEHRSSPAPPRDFPSSPGCWASGPSAP